MLHSYLWQSPSFVRDILHDRLRLLGFCTETCSASSCPFRSYSQQRTSSVYVHSNLCASGTEVRVLSSALLSPLTLILSVISTVFLVVALHRDYPAHERLTPPFASWEPVAKGVRPNRALRPDFLCGGLACGSIFRSACLFYSF